MPVSWHLDAGFVLLESDEAATFDEWKEAVAAALLTAHTEFGADIAVVHDLRRMRRVPALNEAHARMTLLIRRSRTFGVKRWASVVGSAENLAMAETAEVFAAGEPVEFRVFTNLAEAEAWARGR
jgi:hypothetical protein